MKQSIKMKKNSNGITLIALVITIIVLLILAGVTIATLTGDNGILTRASEASQKTKEANKEELKRLTALEAATNVDGTTHTDNSTGTKTTVKIPAGFAVSQVEGENTIKDGLVIIDKNGNEFVWVPVDYSEFERKAGYQNGSQQSIEDYGEADSTGNNTAIAESATTQKEAQEMYMSVQQNGGFYIGRYEVGKDASGNVVIQKGADVYDNVTWSKNKTVNEENEVSGTEENPDGAIELARNFDTANRYTDITSTLIYGVQWDAAMKWMKDITNSNVNGNGTLYVQNSTGMGWYQDNSNSIIQPTGTDLDTNKSNCVNNIYDLAGNVLEWTMETYASDGRYRVYRGGYCNDSGFEYPASTRGSNFPSYSSEGIGFRITLYVK